MSTTSATRVALVEHHLKRLDAVLRSFADDGFYEALDRSAQLGLEIQNLAAFVKIQAEHKAGDLLAKMPRLTPVRTQRRRKRRTSLDLPSQMYSGPPGSLPPQQSAGVRRMWWKELRGGSHRPRGERRRVRRRGPRPGEGIREHHGGSRIWSTPRSELASVVVMPCLVRATSWSALTVAAPPHPGAFLGTQADRSGTCLAPDLLP